MKKLLSLTLLVTLILLPTLSTRAQADTFTVNSDLPIDAIVRPPCTREAVHISGTAHILFHITRDSTDGLHIKMQTNYQGVSGTGLTTGDKYQVIGVSQNEYNSTVGSVETINNSLRYISQGNRDNLLIHALFHVTVNANGTVTASFLNFSRECQ
jgi:hypothetical protein